MQDEIRRLRSLNVSYYKIAKHLGVSGMTISRCAVPGAKERQVRAIQELCKAHPGLWNDYQTKYYLKIRMNVIALLGGKCSSCGETDWRVLEVNHIGGGGIEDRGKYGANPHPFYRAILSGERNTEGLNLLCANCNILHEYQRGKRNKNGRGTLLHNRVVNMLGGRCCKCRNNDLRVLVINHIKGGGCAELKRHQPSVFYRMILNGKRITEDLNVLCANCNVLYKYEMASGALLTKEKRAKSEGRTNG